MWQSVKGQYSVKIIFLIYRVSQKKIHVMYNKVARRGSAEAIVMHFTKRQKYFFVFVLTLTRLLRIQSPALYEQQCGFLYVPQESE